MEYRWLGSTGVRVSPLCMGVMTFGDAADERESARMFGRCLEVGINFFDCANVYGGGESERVLGRLMAGKRDDLVITSKVGMGGGLSGSGGSRRHIMQEVEASLRRLGTDRLDIYFLHRYDDDTPLEETLRAFDDLVRQGKILYPAVSNWAAWQVARAQGLCALHGWAPIACLQPMYSLIKRQAEVEILPMAAELGIGVISYSPLGGGLLSGKYADGPPPQGRLLENDMYKLRYGPEHYWEAARQLAALARERGVHPVTLAVAWAMGGLAITAPIIGARNLTQLEASLAALELELSEAERAELTALTPTPPPANDRLEEQA